jgi:hypothetical protein
MAIVQHVPVYYVVRYKLSYLYFTYMFLQVSLYDTAQLSGLQRRTTNMQRITNSRS